MEAVTIDQIEDELRHLPPEKLPLVLDFVSRLKAQQITLEEFNTAIASEAVLGRDWNSQEEDEAWRHL